jgi:hypothetical protein
MLIPVNSNAYVYNWFAYFDPRHRSRPLMALCSLTYLMQMPSTFSQHACLKPVRPNLCPLSQHITKSSSFLNLLYSSKMTQYKDCVTFSFILCRVGQ